MINQTLFDAFQLWLQGEINTAVAGHTSRIERLEHDVGVQPELNAGLVKRLDFLDGYTTGLYKLIKCLEERLPAQDAGLKTLQDAHLKLRDHVQAMLVPATMDADALLAKIRDAEDWDDVVRDVIRSSAFAEAVNEEVFGRKFTDEVKEAVQDLRFEVSVR